MAGQDDTLRLAELLAARLTHDLSSGIGVLAMLVELIAEQPAQAEESLALAGETAQQLVDRLKLMRAAWGPTAEALDLNTLGELAGGLKQTRCELNLRGLARDTVFDPRFGRMALNLLLLAAESLPAGGEIAFSGHATDLVVAIAGPRAAWPRRLAGCLASRTEAMALMQDTHAIQLAFTALLARALGLRLSVLMAAVAPPGVPPLRLTAH